MLRVIRRPRAKLDIKGIWRYSKKKWGEAQANSYTLSIGEMISSLAENPYKGTAIDHVYENYRQQLIGKHLIIYRVGDTTLEIVRVLKQDMDISRHLN
ncbi:MAG: type II toxin-antitoxin system RelE/ParE family toxin [Alteromonas sp.]|nr:type II toxin-antitoxin system RelE/ParE family toxin [Alteromonas sp.]